MNTTHDINLKSLLVDIISCSLFSLFYRLLKVKSYSSLETAPLPATSYCDWEKVRSREEINSNFLNI